MIPMFEPNIGFHDKKEDILSQWNILAWQSRRTREDYHRASRVLKEKEDIDDVLRQLQQQRQRQNRITSRNQESQIS